MIICTCIYERVFVAGVPPLRLVLLDPWCPSAALHAAKLTPSPGAEANQSPKAQEA